MEDLDFEALQGIHGYTLIRSNQFEFREMRLEDVEPQPTVS